MYVVSSIGSVASVGLTATGKVLPVLEDEQFVTKRSKAVKNPIRKKNNFIK